MRTKRVVAWKKMIPLQIAIAVLVLIITFIMAANSDMKKAEKELVNIVEYMKEQCNDSQIRDMASESKSLLRVTESVEQIRWRLKYEKEISTDSGTLEDYAQDSYLYGLILLDADGKIEEDYDRSGLGCKKILSMTDIDSIMDTLSFPEKSYAIRMELEDESHIDLASVSRIDGDGVLVGYYYTSTEYAKIINNSIRAIVSGFVPETNGTIVISSGNTVVVSNDKHLEGTKVEDTPVLKKIMECGMGTKLIHAKDPSKSFGNQFGVMDKSRDYYIYAFMDERRVFTTTFPNVLSVFLIYLLLLGIVDVMLSRTEKIYQKNQLKLQQKYTRTLEIKNKELEETALQAQKANMAKSRFLSRMSHDIRTPLNGIIGLLKIDEDHFDDTKLVLENHEKMKVSADHLLSLINDVLQMSKLEDGKIEASHELIDLKKLSQDIVTIIKERSVEAGITWEYDKESASISSPYVYGSPVHLRQIFLNIYGNCVKFNRPGGKIKTKVETVSMDHEICTYRWTISDTGRGMSEEFLKRVFEPFAQEKSDARSVYQGTGLGMAIVKGLIDQMGGDIKVTSTEGVGSTFVITLPFEIAPAPAKLSEQKTDSDRDIKGLKLMVVEDNDLNAEIAEMLLTDQGAEVTLVGDGKQAVDLFSESPAGTFDVILMDIMMPVMDGITATKTIRAMAREDAKTIPIIAMTANAFKEDADKCFTAGMNAHLSKPLDIELMKKTILEQLGDRRQ